MSSIPTSTSFLSAPESQAGVFVLWFALLWGTVALLLAPGPSSAQEEVDCYREIPEVYWETDVDSLIRARTDAAADGLRDELARFLWGDSGLPVADRPSRIEIDIEGPERGMTDLARVDAWSVELPFAWQETVELVPGELTATMHLYRTRRPNGRLVLYHRGHQTGPSDTIARRVADFFLGRGYDVGVLSMPLDGRSERHNQLASLPEARGTLLSLFLSPVLVAVNEAEATGEYADITMVGLSGGGWTATVVPAVDERIHRSYPVAGSLPLYLRQEPCIKADRGDWEQQEPALYQDLASYLDLYVLASQGEGRLHHQILNQFDSCCFFGVRYRTYEQQLRSVVVGLEGGAWDVTLDSTHSSHTVSPWVLEAVIGPELRSDDADNDGHFDGEECPDGEPCPDADGDGLADLLESSRFDRDRDGLHDQDDPDDDGDGLPTLLECTSGAPCPDADGDGIPDHLESDSDDLDGDGRVDARDPDDDGDGLPTAEECPDLHGYCPLAASIDVQEHRWPGWIRDDGAEGHRLEGRWDVFPFGFDGDLRQGRPEDLEARSLWRFEGLAPGRYRVQASGVPHGNRSARALYRLLDGESPVGMAVLDQRRAADSYTNAYAVWEDLGRSVLVLGGSLEVVLGTSADGMVIADAVRVEPDGRRRAPLVRVPSGGIRPSREGESGHLEWDSPGLAASLYRVPLQDVGEAVLGGLPYEAVACERTGGALEFPREEGSWAFLLLVEDQELGPHMGCTRLSGRRDCDPPRALPQRDCVD